MEARLFSAVEQAISQPLSAIIFERGFDIDALLEKLCNTAPARGIKVGGLLQVSCGGVGGCAQSVHVMDISSNEKFDIWQDRGPCARGCRLDEQGLAVSEKIIRRAIDNKVELLIINRFGRAESLGRGFVNCFARAMDAGIPTLTSIRQPYSEAWRQFHAGLAVDLDYYKLDWRTDKKAE